MIRVGIIALLIIVTSLLHAQGNNNIEERIKLNLDAPFVSSSTASATVQWKCINKKLTAKCLVYHNDQWFYFTPPSSGKHYINVINQNCKNLKGVQVLVIEGNPCETNTYKLLHCTSFTDQNDTFIELDSLKPGLEYLINIDGFLGDNCEFEIQFATIPVGFPHNKIKLDTVSLTTHVDHQKIFLQWETSQRQLDDLIQFELFRMNTLAAKAVMVAVVPTLTNTLGKHIETYNYSDSLAEVGPYIYRIMGVEKSTRRRVLMDEIRIGFYPKYESEVIKHVVNMPVNFPFAGEVEIVVLDALTNIVLFGSRIEDGRNVIVPLDLTRHVNQGHSYFRISAKHIKSRNVISETFALGQHGEFIKMSK